MIQEAEQKKMSDSNTPPTNFEGAFANLETAFLEAAARPDITVFLPPGCANGGDPQNPTRGSGGDEIHCCKSRFLSFLLFNLQYGSV
jgi:hypothetical protein